MMQEKKISNIINLQWTKSIFTNQSQQHCSRFSLAWISSQKYRIPIPPDCEQSLFSSKIRNLVPRVSHLTALWGGPRPRGRLDERPWERGWKIRGEERKTSKRASVTVSVTSNLTWAFRRPRFWRLTRTSRLQSLSQRHLFCVLPQGFRRKERLLAVWSLDCLSKLYITYLSTFYKQGSNFHDLIGRKQFHMVKSN